MKKAFDQNVSRAKPRVKLGAPEVEAEVARAPLGGGDEAWVYEVAAQVAGQSRVVEPPAPTTAREVLSAASHAPASEATSRARVEATLREVAEPTRPPPARTALPDRESRLPEPEARTPAARAAAELRTRPATEVPAARAAAELRSRPAPELPAARVAAEPRTRPAPEVPIPAAPQRAAVHPAPTARIEQPRAPAAPSPDDMGARREKLRERLRSVRENPRPEPLPTSVAAAGVMVVERIAHLQAELVTLKGHNAALQHDLDVAHRTAERATEEARSRVEEARRLSSQMEERSGLLAELERELQSVEAERDESLLAVQEARSQAVAERDQRELLAATLIKKDAALAESLSEEERLATELETFRDDTLQLRRMVDALSAERDTLARQVSDLTSERAELLEARKALESVHRALTDAVNRR